MIRDELIEWLVELDPNLFVTVNFGYGVRKEDGEPKIKHLLNCIQREALGRNWLKLPPEARFQAVGFWEHTERWSNPHLHAAVVAPAPLDSWMLHRGPERWLEIAPRGQLHVVPVRSPERVVSYASKHIRRGDDFDKAFIYTADRPIPHRV